MSALGSRAFAQSGASGSYSNSAIAVEASGQTRANTDEDVVRAVKVARAMRAGPIQIARDATVAEMDQHGNMARILRSGTNGWVCTPGDENRIGDPPMCVDELGMQWFKDALAGRPRPTNKAPGLCYMLCGATQHSNTDPAELKALDMQAQNAFVAALFRIAAGKHPLPSLRSSRSRLALAAA